MATQPDDRDERDRQLLFDRVYAILEDERSRDATLGNFNRQPMLFSLTRNGSTLKFWYGSGRTIAEGQIDPPWHPDHDQPNRFKVSRSAIGEGQFILDHGASTDLEATARAIVDWFISGSAS